MWRVNCFLGDELHAVIEDGVNTKEEAIEVGESFVYRNSDLDEEPSFNVEPCSVPRRSADLDEGNFENLSLF